ncbi:13680_t:CDS:2 [Funneliformis caledonium]|uniref:13680_t:CDS:1 n=1 Tax=Funneliformis caledonium TaxID=1117310 RepID=A0A9N8VSW5_9GLOM|nr:13680_t:CDS:2 [Funneliformis caledonium]
MEVLSREHDNGNEFGENIPYRKGKAIQLVKYEKGINDEIGTITLIKEGLKIIQDIEEPVAIISIVGSYRRGKSYFANVLHGRHDGFELGSKVDSCTKGIFMWDTPFLYKDHRVIVLDCEGIDDPKQDEIWAKKLFILCLAISSTFIYNINGIVGRDDIGKLFMMTDLSKFLAKGEENEKDYLPRLVVLLRDFGLECPDDFKEYFLDKLTQVDPDAADGILNHFEDFDVYALPHPGCKKKALHNLEQIKTSQLDPDFVAQTSETISYIYDTISTKQINSKPLSGILFSKFLKDCIQHMNATTLNALSLPTHYTSLIKFMSNLAKDMGVSYYYDKMTKFSDRFPKDWDSFDYEHTIILSDADFRFTEKLIGNYHQTTDAREEFNSLIEKEKQKFVKMNSDNIKNYNLNLANSLWRVHIKPGLTADYLFEDYNQFDVSLDNFMQEYTNKSLQSPEAMEIYTQFKHQETEIALDTLKKMFEMRDVIKSTKDAHEELINQINQYKERLDQLLDENIQDESDHNKRIEEFVSTIENLEVRLSQINTSDN